MLLTPNKDLLSDVGRIAEDGLNPEDYHLAQLLVLKLRLDQNKSPDPAVLEGLDEEFTIWQTRAIKWSPINRALFVNRYWLID